MLRGDLEGEALERYVKESVLTTTVDKAVAWSQGNSIWPLTFGLACCAIEMMSIVGARVDVARFGWEAFWASPRQADLLILSGRVSVKMAPVIRRIYDQMLEPRWAISMGACCSSMGVFNNYALVPADKFLPDRRARARLPAATRGAAARHPPPAREDPRHRARRVAGALPRSGHRRSSPQRDQLQRQRRSAINVFPGGDTAGA